ncbi:hypothetical protein GDO81_024849 [Engystomops pustulosus]|uniref:ribonuclease H n=1 Tax=Engystomops pustulosus TaxID=76066 RepID=A0AAV6YTY2_ENGPU|nr:hypothetical protein GDO81_024849 [Engystomops pustulosus]
MESVRSATHIIHQDALMCTIDLKDAYYHIPIHHFSQRFLRFSVLSPEGATLHFQFCALPFGISSAPRTFTKVMAEVVASLRLQDVLIVPYLDDLLIVGQDRGSLLFSRDLTLETLKRLGWIVNYQKSELSPATVRKFLGVNLNSVYQMSFLPQDKGDHIKDLITRFRRKSVISIREAMKILGSLTACISSVAWCQAHSRILQGWILRSWNRKQEDLDRKIPIPPAVKEDLLWWLEDGNLRKGIFWSNSPYIPIQTDASQRGWGAVMPQQFSQGTWTEEITRRSSNFRELQAVWEALSANTPLLAHQHLLILSDNTTTVSYIKRQGGTRSPLLSTLARKIFSWAEQHTLSISATHLKGTENSRADFLSRRKILPNEWSLKEEIFQGLTSLWGYPLVDLFATRENTKCLHYFSLEKGENRERLDAFSHSWDIPLVYAFPPIPLIARVLRKISQENTRAIFICPNWPKKSWYPLLKKMSPENPVILPPSEDLLHQGPIHHPNPGKLQLSAWILNPAS